MKSIWEKYEDWLLDRVGFVDTRYLDLMACLHRIPFKDNFGMDKNRKGDALELRRNFLEEERMNQYSLDYYEDCYVLEVLVALAIRVDDEYIGNPEKPRPDRFLWEMITNLGLEKCSNSRFKENEIFDITVRWMCRNFRKNGEGSIFPIKKPTRDQRKIEIWDQLMEYLRENYS